MILLLSLFSPLTELFPNVYMSWWMPSNQNLENYRRFWYRRVWVVLVVWVPILIVLARIVSPLTVGLIAAVIFGAFGWRMVAVRRYIDAKLGGADVELGGEGPEGLYFIALAAILVIVYRNLATYQWLVVVAAVGIFGGALLIGRFRGGKHRSLRLDVFARVVFSAGFLVNLHNLARSAEIL